MRATGFKQSFCETKATLRLAESTEPEAEGVAYGQNKYERPIHLTWAMSQYVSSRCKAMGLIRALGRVSLFSQLPYNVTCFAGAQQGQGGLDGDYKRAKACKEELARLRGAAGG